MDNEEIWREVPYYENLIVSNLGNVKRKSTGKLIRPSIGHYGYGYVSSKTKDGIKTVSVHKLVLLAFVGPKPKDKNLCAHGDGNTANNKLSNLRWATFKENSDDRWKHGTMTFGVKVKQAKITDEIALEIRRRYVKRKKGSPGNLYKLAEEFGVSYPTIYHVLHRYTWKHVATQEVESICGK